MQIDLSQVDRNSFNLRKDIIPGVGEFILITPKKRKLSWADHELHLRSLMVDSEGTIVSSGFPKFFEYGEHLLSDRLISDASRNQNILYTEKEDGILVIRDVINGVVCFRTEGNHTLGKYTLHIMETIQARHRKLLDPGYMPSESMLFEFGSPETQKIVPYDMSRMVYLGSMLRETLHEIFVPQFESSMECVTRVQSECRIQSPQYKTYNSIDDAYHLTRDQIDSEGLVVIAFSRNGTTILGKIDTAWYRCRHKFKTNVNRKIIWYFCYLANVASEVDFNNQFHRYFASISIDWHPEVLHWVRAYVSRRKFLLDRYTRFKYALLAAGLIGSYTYDFNPSIRQNKIERLKALCVNTEWEDEFFPIGTALIHGRSGVSLSLVHAKVLKISYAHLLSLKRRSLNVCIKSIRA